MRAQCRKTLELSEGGLLTKFEIFNNIYAMRRVQCFLVWYAMQAFSGWQFY